MRAICPAGIGGGISLLRLLCMSSENGSRSEFLPSLLRLFAIWTTVLGLLCGVTELACRLLPRYGLNKLPYEGPTLPRADNYADVWLFNNRFRHFHTPSFFDRQWGTQYLYPAPLSFFYRALRIFPHTTPVMLGFLLLIYVALAVWLARTLVREGLGVKAAIVFVAVSLVFSYPLFFEFNRANMEIFVWGLAGLGVMAFVRNRPWLAATLIGLAAACKGFPFIYLGLLLARRQYRQMVYSLALAMAVNYFSLWALAGTIAAGKAGVLAGVNEFRVDNVLRLLPEMIGLDHSIFGMVKRFWPHLPSPPELGHVLTVYMGCAAVVACTLYFLRAWRLPVLNQVMFLTVACIVLPPVSYDYTLLHLYTPWVMLVLLIVRQSRAGREVPPGVGAAVVCFVILMSPENEFILHGERFAGQIKCLVLLALAFVALRFPMEREGGEIQAGDASRLHAPDKVPAQALLGVR